MKEKNILRIYADETGDNGTSKGSSNLYGFSFVFHESKNDITKELNKLNRKLEYIDLKDMLHITDLIMNRKEYQYINSSMRKKIFYAMYYFYKKAKINSKSFFLKKKDLFPKDDLNKRIYKLLSTFIKDNYKYFSKFDEVILYYDNGQIPLGEIFDNCFSELSNFKHINNFDKEKERLFQVADMITFLDKLRYKKEHKIIFNSGEKNFFIFNEMKIVIEIVKKKEFKSH